MTNDINVCDGKNYTMNKNIKRKSKVFDKN